MKTAAKIPGLREDIEKFPIFIGLKSTSPGVLSG